MTMADHIFVKNSAGMSAFEAAIFRSVFTEIGEQLDPLTIVSALRRSGIVTEDFMCEVMGGVWSGESRGFLVEMIVQHIPQQVSFLDVVKCLNVCGYKEVATRLYLTLIQSSCRMNCVQKVPNKENSGMFFLRLKTLIHDAQLKNPRHFLRNMAIRFKANFEIEPDETKKQKLADKCIAVLGAEIDSYYDSLGCESEVTQESMLQEMREMIAHTSNPSLSDVIYHSRHANMDAYQKDYTLGENMLIQARTSAYTIGTCVEIVNMLYIEVYVKLWEFETNPTPEKQELILLWGRIGLQGVEDLPFQMRTTWRRMFILRMVYGLLGLGNRGNIVQGCTVYPPHLALAQDLLAKIDGEWSGIETRREMFYAIARARVNELLGLNQECLLYLDRASYLAETGRFLEKIPFIESFRESVQRKILNSEAIRMATFQLSEECISNVTEAGFSNSVKTSTIPQKTDDNDSITEVKARIASKATADNRHDMTHLTDVKNVIEKELSHTRSKGAENTCGMGLNCNICLLNFNTLDSTNEDDNKYVNSLTEVKQLAGISSDESDSRELTSSRDYICTEDSYSKSVNNSFRDFNSVVLFENREEPEGKSQEECICNKPIEATDSCGVDNSAANDLRDDFDDEALFGDGTAV